MRAVPTACLTEHRRAHRYVWDPLRFCTVFLRQCIQPLSSLPACSSNSLSHPLLSPIGNTTESEGSLQRMVQTGRTTLRFAAAAILV